MSVGSLALTPAELVEVTGKVRACAQERALRGMGIDHRRRPDGTLYVPRAAALLDGLARAKVPEEFELPRD